jgi:TRAP-type C4-dicarboxylate transport system permease small subunit
VSGQKIENINKMNYIEKLFEIQKKQPKTEKLIHVILCIYTLLSILAVCFIKLYVRRQHFELNTTLDYLQGTLPNFFAATGICGVVFFYANLLSKTGTYKRKLLYAFVFTFVGLTSWEYIQYFMGYPIDYHDILMSFIGCIITVGFVLILKRIFRNETNNL